MAGKLLILACGALGREIESLRQHLGRDLVDLQCLDAELHNRPEHIPDRVDALLAEHHGHYERVFVAYGDCGTGGRLDAVLARWNVERLPGAHCYAFYATPTVFDAMSADEPGTFYLTDFLVRHFDRLVIRGLQLDRHPTLKAQLFGNYQRVVYLVQRPDAALRDRAERAAEWLALPLETVTTGLGLLGEDIRAQILRLHESPGTQHAAH